MATLPNPPAQAFPVDPTSLPIENPSNITPVYSNHFGVTATMTDFTIFFLEVGAMPGPKGPIHRQELKAAVTLPMAAIEGLAQVASQLLKQAEQAKAQIEKMKASGSKK
jgi:hypothetical protein